MFHFSRNSIDVFGLSIHYYGILIALGVLLGVLLAARRQKRLNLPPETGLDLALICLARGGGVRPGLLCDFRMERL